MYIDKHKKSYNKPYYPAGVRQKIKSFKNLPTN